MTAHSAVAGVEINAKSNGRQDEILSAEALAFIAELHRRFNRRRLELLVRRMGRQEDFDAGKLPNFLAETKSIRDGDWKLEICPGSGGNSKPTDPTAAKKELPSLQLYDMTTDVGETRNLENAQPQVVERLATILGHYVAAGRSTAGATLRNDVPVDIWKDDANSGSEPDDGGD